MIIAVDFNTEYSTELIRWLSERGIAFDFRDAVPPAPSPEGIVQALTLSEILECAAVCFGVEVDDIISKTRRQNCTFARHAYCLAAVELMKESSVKIGRKIDRHHASVLNSVKASRNMIATGYGDFEIRYECLKVLLQ